MKFPPAEFPRFFQETVGRPLRTGVLLRDHSNFRIGGPADFFFEAVSIEEVRTALSAARSCGIRSYLIGGGYNLLFADAGFRGLIVKNAAGGMSLERLSPEKYRLIAMSGTPLGDLVEFCAANALSGLEFLTGIPGSVGGAVYGNAGAFGRCLGDVLEEADLLSSEGIPRRETRKYFEFAYRHSRLKATGEVVLQASFVPAPGDRAEIRFRMDEILALRASRHPSRGLAYAGSYFKNYLGPDGVKTPAGYLLDQVGSKEAAVGGAAVFAGHANFLYNRGDATAADILTLARELKERVRAKFGLDLAEEVIFLQAEPEDG